MSSQENVLSQPAASDDEQEIFVSLNAPGEESEVEEIEQGNNPAMGLNPDSRMAHLPIVDGTQVIVSTAVGLTMGDRWVAPLSFKPLARLAQTWPRDHHLKMVDWVRPPKAYTAPMDRALPVIQSDAPAAPQKCTACQKGGLFSVCTVHPGYSKSGACTSCILLHNPSGCSHYVAPAAKDPLRESLALVDDPEQLSLLLQDPLNRLNLYLAHKDGGVPVWPEMPPVRQRRLLLRSWAAHDGFAVVPQETYDQMKERLAKIRYKYIQEQIRDDKTIPLPKGASASGGSHVDMASMGPLVSKKRDMEASGLKPVAEASAKKKLKVKQPLSSATMPVDGGSESESDSTTGETSAAAQTLLSAFTASSSHVAAVTGPSASAPGIIPELVTAKSMQLDGGEVRQGQGSVDRGKAAGAEIQPVVKTGVAPRAGAAANFPSELIQPISPESAVSLSSKQTRAMSLRATEGDSGVDGQAEGEEELLDRVVLPLPAVKPGWFERLSNMMRDAQFVWSGTWMAAGGYPISISAEDIAVLDDPAGWLNDTIIAGYCRILCQAVNSSAGTLMVAWVDSAFVSVLYHDAQQAKNMGGYASICQEVNQAGVTVLPVHDSKKEHWFLVAVMPGRREAWLFDSFRYYEQSEQDALLPLVSPILNWLNKTHDGLKGVDLGGWTVHPNVSPIQDNTDDCGIFVCATLRYLVCRQDVSRPLPYSQVDVPAFRAHLRCELVLGALQQSVLPEDPVIYKEPLEFVRDSPTVKDYLNKHKKESHQSLLDSFAIEDEVSGGDPSAEVRTEAVSQN
ncbi:Peptidase C48, SUMO/Sentrin/Ubl1 [Ascosphaera apis ARSEF 7405]|uniref:Peptidase C48, SUMO/Sentrin/Ubl1 n=1 Tax=Ascosphaera apis ARSEF 7405 TaxID=392613 RepID=A0A167USU5_9EURO|nr:Peptidase C48, SUMO/Sentrin/Ubl1 [Ascosphaera apis ARSEF 7405]